MLRLRSCAAHHLTCCETSPCFLINERGQGKLQVQPEISLALSTIESESKNTLTPQTGLGARKNISHSIRQTWTSRDYGGSKTFLRFYRAQSRVRHLRYNIAFRRCSPHSSQLHPERKVQGMWIARINNSLFQRVICY
jgi:hypothetical protein